VFRGSVRQGNEEVTFETLDTRGANKNRILTHAYKQQQFYIQIYG